MRVLIALLVLALLAAALFSMADNNWRTGTALRSRPAAKPVVTIAPEPGRVSAISFLRARPGQRERLERFLQSNWLALDEQALQQNKIKAYRMLRADPDPKESSWDYAVIIDYADRQAMADFVPFYLALVRERPHLRVDGLDFADLGEVVQQKVVEPVVPRDEPH